MHALQPGWMLTTNLPAMGLCTAALLEHRQRKRYLLYHIRHGQPTLLYNLPMAHAMHAAAVMFYHMLVATASRNRDDHQH